MFVDKNMLSQDPYYNVGKNVINIFIGCATLSYIYTIIIGKYNGDFMAEDVELPSLLLFVNWFAAIIPFVVLKKIYTYYKQKRYRVAHVSINFHFFSQFLFFLFFWHIVVTLLFNVGKLGSPMYDAPALLTPVIQLFNRFNPNIVGLIFILVSPNRRKIFIVCCFMILLGVLRAGLGVFVFIGLSLFVRYNEQMFYFVRRWKILILLMLLFFPSFVDYMYDLRTSLRTENVGEGENLSVINLIGGKLIGRLSSFSNSGIIIQNPVYFIASSQMLDDYYFQKQALAGVLGVSYAPEERPEIHLIKSVEPMAENSSFMTGSQGNLIISLYKSPYIFLMNLFTILVLVCANFHFAIKLGFSQSTEFALINVVYCVMSGVPNEFTYYLFTTLLLYILFNILNLISNGNKSVVRC